MTDIVCIRCGYKTTLKANLKRHLRKKKTCKPIFKNTSIKECLKQLTNKGKYNNKTDNPIKIKEVDEIEYSSNTKVTQNDHSSNTKVTQIEYSSNTDSSINYKCEFCDTIFKKKNSYYRHKKHYCKEDPLFIKSEFDIKMAETMRADKELIVELKREIGKLLEKVGNVTNITNNNLIINVHGNEDLSYITDRYLNDLLKIPFGAIPYLLQNIHFHPKHPENRNVKITNKKLGYASVWVGNKWCIRDKKEIIENMVEKGFNILDNKYCMDSNLLESKKKKNYINFQTKYENGEKSLLKELKKDIELLVINNTGII